MLVFSERAIAVKVLGEASRELEMAALRSLLAQGGNISMVLQWLGQAGTDLTLISYNPTDNTPYIDFFRHLRGGR